MSKTKNALGANFIQHMDAFVIHRIFSVFRRVYIPGIGFPVLPVFAALTLPIILLPYVMSVYRQVNYDIFMNKGTVQDFNEYCSLKDYDDNLPSTLKFFKNNGEPLFETYFEHFISDLEIQIGNTPEDKEDVALLTINIKRNYGLEKGFHVTDYQYMFEDEEKGHHIQNKIFTISSFTNSFSIFGLVSGNAFWKNPLNKTPSRA